MTTLKGVNKKHCVALFHSSVPGHSFLESSLLIVVVDVVDVLSADAINFVLLEM